MTRRRVLPARRGRCGSGEQQSPAGCSSSRSRRPARSSPPATRGTRSGWLLCSPRSRSLSGVWLSRCPTTPFARGSTTDRWSRQPPGQARGSGWPGSARRRRSCSCSSPTAGFRPAVAAGGVAGRFRAGPHRRGAGARAGADRGHSGRQPVGCPGRGCRPRRSGRRRAGPAVRQHPAVVRVPGRAFPRGAGRAAPAAEVGGVRTPRRADVAGSVDRAGVDPDQRGSRRPGQHPGVASGSPSSRSRSASRCCGTGSTTSTSSSTGRWSTAR